MSGFVEWAAPSSRGVWMACIGMLALLAVLDAPAAANGSYEIDLLSHIECGHSTAVAVRDHTLFAGLEQTLLVLDVSDPAHPQRVASTLADFLGGGIRDIKLVGHYAVVATTHSLRIYDIAGRGAPALVGVLDAGIGNFAVSRNTVIAPLGNKVLRAIDITDKTQPSVISSVTLGGYVGDVAISGNYAYVVGGIPNAYLRVVDISDPAAMTEVANTRVPAPSSLCTMRPAAAWQS